MLLFNMLMIEADAIGTFNERNQHASKLLGTTHKSGCKTVAFLYQHKATLLCMSDERMYTRVPATTTNEMYTAKAVSN